MLKDCRQMSGRDLQLRFEVFRNFNSADYEALKRLLFRKTFKKGEYVCRKDEESDSMYFIAKGTADITIPLANTKREKRLETLEPGTFFGEMALIEGRTRSANVRAHSDLVCLILKKKQYWEMKANHGEMYMKMMINILKTISSRLRYANITISELES